MELNLPNDIWISIFSLLDISSIFILPLVCKKFQEICHEADERLLKWGVEGEWSFPIDENMKSWKYFYCRMKEEESRLKHIQGIYSKRIILIKTDFEKIFQLKIGFPKSIFAFRLVESTYSGILEIETFSGWLRILDEDLSKISLSLQLNIEKHEKQILDEDETTQSVPSYSLQTILANSLQNQIKLIRNELIVELAKEPITSVFYRCM